MSDWTTNLPRRACNPGWEQDPRIDDGHGHDWHVVAIESSPGHVELMTVCRVCTAPRCGFTNDPDPCTERRHHRDMHIYESGRFEPLGGILPPECTCGREGHPEREHEMPCEVADLHERRERIRARERREAS